MRKVLVTGAAGYIGCVLVRQLLERGYKVRGADALFFGGESLLSVYNNPNFEFFKGDIRSLDFIREITSDVNDVIHLAAIVGDPACSKQPELANDINWTASKKLFDECNNKINVEHFVFASTCSNYGKMDGEMIVNEESALKPVSLYAELKVKFENYLLETNIRNSFLPTALRFSTVYGLSPRMRFDLTVNEFVRDVTMGKELVIFGEKFWRPYCHVEDLASACILVLNSPREKILQNVFNVGDSKENYQKQMIAEEILKLIKDARVKYVHKEEDPRDYKVDFSKIESTLGFKIKKRISDGIKEVYKVLKDGIISNPYSQIYKNI